MDKNIQQTLYAALNLWANYVETGNVNLSRKDLLTEQEKKHVLALEDCQIKRIIELRELAAYILDTDIIKRK